MTIIDATKIPRYRSNKTVGAFKIVMMERALNGGWILIGEQAQSQSVPEAWYAKHQPQIGGYAVLYGVQEMHLSFCPAESFEADHTYLGADRWKSHKEVGALQVRGVSHLETNQGSKWALRFAELDHPVVVTGEWQTKHTAVPGGYYILYRDGYTSYSPALTFEAGYVRI